MIRVLIADDHQLLIDGLCSVLQKQAGIEVVGVAKDGLEAAKLAFELKPDIILMDISMPGLNGIDATRRILQQESGIKIIMLSMHADRRYIQESLRVGASGYILKESAAGEVIEAIKVVRNGRPYFSQSVREQVIQDYVERIRDGNESSESPLTGREREVLQILAEGKSTKDVATMLNVSVKTIETHRRQIMEKLGVRSIAELTKYAIREGITQLDQ